MLGSDHLLCVGMGIVCISHQLQSFDVQCLTDGLV